MNVRSIMARDVGSEVDSSMMKVVAEAEEEAVVVERY
jgi:hypothetical protein